MIPDEVAFDHVMVIIKGTKKGARKTCMVNIAQLRLISVDKIVKPNGIIPIVTMAIHQLLYLINKSS